MNYKLLIILFMLPLLTLAQRIDNTASYRDMGADRYFRFHYDNDFFTATDFNYTQGYTFEVVTPWLKKNPINYILFKRKGLQEALYGVAFEQTGFTPPDITSAEIQHGERPYAATIALKSFTILTDITQNTRFSGSLTLGMIGPAAFGNEMQTGIHKWIDDDLPQGWQYQIKNDLILDYEITFEKQVLNLADILMVNSHSRVRLGTLNTNAATGFNVTLGLKGDLFSVHGKRPFEIYLYTQPMASVVGYDATLQGGLFNNDSPYTISSRNVERFVLQNHFGLVLKYHSFYLEYSRAMITREFKAGHSHKWGGFRIGFRI